VLFTETMFDPIKVRARAIGIDSLPRGRRNGTGRAGEGPSKLVHGLGVSYRDHHPGIFFLDLLSESLGWAADKAGCLCLCVAAGQHPWKVTNLYKWLGETFIFYLERHFSNVDGFYVPWVATRAEVRTPHCRRSRPLKAASGCIPSCCTVPEPCYFDTGTLGTNRLYGDRLGTNRMFAEDVDLLTGLPGRCRGRSSS
jgi:hypothetical protein